MIQYTNWTSGHVERWLKQRTYGAISIESNVASMYESRIFIHSSENLSLSKTSKKLIIELTV